SSQNMADLRGQAEVRVAGLGSVQWQHSNLSPLRRNGPLSPLARARLRHEAPDLPGLRMSGQCFDHADRDPRPRETAVAEAIADRRSQFGHIDGNAADTT